MRCALRRLFCASLSATVIEFGAAVGSASAQTNVLFIVDASGSMRTRVEGRETRMSVAKRALSLALRDMPKEARLGMILYGHRRAKDCKDIELVAPIASEDAASLAERVEALQPRGETPIADALMLALRSFRALKGQNNMMVLVTDGIEECGGDPCAAARAIKAEGLNLKAHIVGFTLSAKQRAAIECVVKETGGTYFDAKDPRALRTALQSIKKQVAEPGPASPPPAPPPPERFSLIARKNGGEALFSSGPQWGGTIDGNFDYVYGFGRGGQEAVYAFADSAAATFDTFAVFVPSTLNNHPKEMELFAGDAGPTGVFHSLGVITVANGKLRDGWQEFKLPKTTAKFLKVRLISNHGGNDTYLYELALYGELEKPGGPGTPTPLQARANILLQVRGAEALPPSKPDWSRTNDGNLGYLYGFGVGDEGIFGFGGRTATFDGFAVYIPGDDTRHPKELELFAGDEGPVGAFRSIGVVTLANGKLRDGWQEFRLTVTTAKFLKVKIVSNHGGNGVYLYELRLYGELK